MSHQPRSSRASLVLAAPLVLLALSLRVGLGGLGGLIPTVQDVLGLSEPQVSVLTTLPSLCFSLAGLAAGRIILRFGVHQVVVVVSLVGVAGLLLRSVTNAATVFLLATALAMIGAAIGNVTLPVLTKLHFPSRVNGVTALYSGALGLSAAVSATAAVPLAHATGSWRIALGSWAVVPALAALTWLPRSLGDLRRPGPLPGTLDATPGDAPSLWAVARTPLGWALALCFGCQAGQAYVQFGYWADLTVAKGGTSSHAGQLIAAMNLTVIPMALCMPLFIRAAGRSAVLPTVFAGLTVAGYLGVLIGPRFLSGWLWAALLGSGGGAFTWVFSMVGRRTQTPAATAQLAAFVQGGGYLIASGITVLFGAIHSAASDWATPITTVMGIAVGIGIFGWGVTRSRDLEHYLGGKTPADIADPPDAVEEPERLRAE
jgi:CP family cyanate transporter-like MFS transporter